MALFWSIRNATRPASGGRRQQLRPAYHRVDGPAEEVAQAADIPRNLSPCRQGRRRLHDGRHRRCACSTPMGASSASSTFTRTGDRCSENPPNPQLKGDPPEDRSAFPTPLSCLAPLQALADLRRCICQRPSKSRSPPVTFGQRPWSRRVPATIRAEAALALLGS